MPGTNFFRASIFAKSRRAACSNVSMSLLHLLSISRNVATESPVNAETSSTNVEFSAKPQGEAEVSDGELAATLMDEVIGTRGIREPVKSMLERAYSELSKRNRAWTRRRVRAVFNREANRIEHREIEEMRAVIAARKKHADYRKETARLAQMAVLRAKAHDCDLDS